MVITVNEKRQKFVTLLHQIIVINSNHACNIHILDIYVCVCVGVNEMFLYNISADCLTLLIAENSPINLTNLA